MLGNLRVVEILEAALDLHVMVLRVGKGLLDSKLERLPSHSQIIDMVIFEFNFTHPLLLSINQGLLLQHLVNSQV